jgi:superoxide dismutase
MLAREYEGLRRCQTCLDRVLADREEYRDHTVPQLLTGQIDPALRSHVRHWAGGVYAYGLCLDSLAPALTTEPSPLLRGAIDAAFGSLAGLCRVLQNAAPGPEGFVWLTTDCRGRLQVNRLYQHAAPLPLIPLLTLPASLLPSPGICERLDWHAASRRYREALTCRPPHLL